MVTIRPTGPTRAEADRPEPAHPRLEEVAEGVFAHIQPDGGWCLNNAGILVDEGRAALVDTAATERRTLLLRQALATVAPQEPEVLVNTHHHSDHTFGNSLFGPGTTVVAHERTRQESAEAGLGLQGLWPGVDWGAVSVRLPALTFRDTLTLHLGGLRVELIHVGPAHTTNDTVVWIPDRGVLFTGDVVMSGVTPYALMGSVEGSLRALDQLAELHPRVVVPGHGAVGGPGLIAANRAYFAWIQQLDTEARAAGLTPLQAAKDADLGGFADLLDPERLVSNLHRARLEAEGGVPGAPIDILGSFREMVEYHGGLPTCHA
ncbi:MBL fold metallo-hydrolase [Streptacidiphilus sp. N1-10]|uniref:MBL fold metallo-hydrolase n=1 Tax=Streptacidiphilus jeojiensis TaxID=3229225 RepID=A0ABV6XHC5_9ACTN